MLVLNSKIDIEKEVKERNRDGPVSGFPKSIHTLIKRVVRMLHVPIVNGDTLKVCPADSGLGRNKSGTV